MDGFGLDIGIEGRTHGDGHCFRCGIFRPAHADECVVVGIWIEEVVFPEGFAAGFEFHDPVQREIGNQGLIAYPPDEEPAVAEFLEQVGMKNMVGGFFAKGLVRNFQDGLFFHGFKEIGEPLCAGGHSVFFKLDDGISSMDICCHGILQALTTASISSAIWKPPTWESNSMASRMRVISSCFTREYFEWKNLDRHSGSRSFSHLYIFRWAHPFRG